MALKIKKETDTIKPQVEVLPPINIDTAFLNEIEILRYAADVKSRLRSEITADFTLAKCSEQDKQGIIDLTTDAYMAKRMQENVVLKMRVWEWNKEEQHWHQRPPNDIEKETCKKIIDNTFDAYMTKVQMTAIMNRNVKDNDLLKMLAIKPEEPQTTILDEEGQPQILNTTGQVKQIVGKLLKPDKKKDQ